MFKNFDILSGDSAISDHSYIGANKLNEVQAQTAAFNNPTSNVSKRIVKEWRILERDLPESIYVRVYEQRLDLLRAVIVGSPGTPYHDGLFVFDIVLPPDYPHHPPKVNYHSHGYCLNPNLYASGYVCLSLINTWQGRAVERWSTSTSTILQLLVSLQGLVLNDNPYFNEPMVAVGLQQLKNGILTGFWHKKVMNYNQNVFVYSCRTMIHKMKRPPKGFERLVFEHFRQRQEVILSAINAYRDGTAVVGHYQQGGSSSTNPVHVSRGFKSSLSKTYKDLQKAFIQFGISPPEAIDRGEGSQSTGSSKPNRGFKSKVINALKKLFG